MTPLQDKTDFRGPKVAQQVLVLGSSISRSVPSSDGWSDRTSQLPVLTAAPGCSHIPSPTWRQGQHRPPASSWSQTQLLAGSTCCWCRNTPGHDSGAAFVRCSWSSTELCQIPLEEIRRSSLRSSLSNLHIPGWEHRQPPLNQLESPFSSCFPWKSARNCCEH